MLYLRQAVKGGQALIIDILSIRGSIAKLSRSVNVPLALLVWEDEGREDWQS
jgi:hypothetical protein